MQGSFWLNSIIIYTITMYYYISYSNICNVILMYTCATCVLVYCVPLLEWHGPPAPHLVSSPFPLPLSLPLSTFNLHLSPPSISTTLVSINMIPHFPWLDPTFVILSILPISLLPLSLVLSTISHDKRWRSRLLWTPIKASHTLLNPYNLSSRDSSLPLFLRCTVDRSPQSRFSPFPFTLTPLIHYDHLIISSLVPPTLSLSPSLHNAWLRGSLVFTPR